MCYFLLEILRRKCFSSKNTTGLVVLLESRTWLLRKLCWYVGVFLFKSLVTFPFGHMGAVFLDDLFAPILNILFVICALRQNDSIFRIWIRVELLLRRIRTESTSHNAFFFFFFEEKSAIFYFIFFFDKKIIIYFIDLLFVSIDLAMLIDSLSGTSVHCTWCPLNSWVSVDQMLNPR